MVGVVGGDDDGGDGEGVGLQHAGDGVPLCVLGVGGGEDDEVGPGGVAAQDEVPGSGEKAGDAARGVLAAEVVAARDGVGQDSPHLVTVNLDQAVLHLHLGRERHDGQPAVDWQVLSDELVGGLGEPGPAVGVRHVGRGLQGQHVLPHRLPGNPQLRPGVGRGRAVTSGLEVLVGEDDVKGGAATAEDAVLGGEEGGAGVAVGRVGLHLQAVTQGAGQARGLGQVGDKQTVSIGAIGLAWQTFLSIPGPGSCQHSIVCYGGKNTASSFVVTRIESVITESRLVKYSVTVFGPEVGEGGGLPGGDVVGGEECVREEDSVPRTATAPALLGVRVVAVVEVAVGHQDVTGPSRAGNIWGDGWDSADLSGPGGRDDDGDGAEVERLTQGRGQGRRGQVKQILARETNCY